MSADLLFYLTAIPAVVITGLGKGGLGNAWGMIAVPLMALVIPPVQAAAILLPLLLTMDLFAIWGYRNHIHKPTLKLIIIPGLVGVVLGSLLFSQLPDNIIRILIGFIAISFCLYQWLGSRYSISKKPNKLAGCFWSTVAGFTSFGIHSGGPPLSIYMLPLKLDKQKLAGTMAIFFGIINLAKLVAYGQIGQLNTDNLLISALLLPLCPLSVFLGMYIIKKIDQKTFYYILYIGLMITGIKLIYSGF